MINRLTHAIQIVVAALLLTAANTAIAQERCAGDTDTALTGLGVHGPVLGISVEPQLARVVRIRQTQDGDFPWWSIGELKIYPQSASTPLQVADYQAYRGSPDIQSARRALDGKSWTYWQTAQKQNSSQSFTVELNEPAIIDCISLHAQNKPGDYPRGYEVTVWPDLNGYHADQGTVNNSETVFEFAPLQARYVRLVQTGMATRWWAISELDVFASDGVTKLEGTSTWSASATSSAGYRGETPDKAIDGNRASVWSSGKAQAGDEHFMLDLGAAKTLAAVRAVSVNGDSSRNDFPAELMIELSNDGTTWFDPQTPPTTESTAPHRPLGDELVSTEVGFGTDLTLSDEHWHSLGLTVRGFKRFQTISSVLANHADGRTRIITTASLDGLGPQGDQGSNEDGLILEVILNDNGTVTPVARTIYPECKEMVSVIRGPGDAIAALCRSRMDDVQALQDAGVSITNLQQEYIDNRNTTKYDGKVDLDALLLYVWETGDTTQQPDRYIVSTHVGSAEIGEFEMCSVEHRYDISAKIGNCFINNSNALECHETDRAFAVNRNTGSDVQHPTQGTGYFIERFNDDGGIGTRGWFNSGGFGHTSHNRLACNASTNESAVMIAADGSTIAPFFGVNVATLKKQGTQRGNEQPTFLHLQTAGGFSGFTKGGPGAFHPLDDGYIGIVVGAEGNAALGELDYVQNGRNVEPLLKIGIAKFDGNGVLLDPTQPVQWVVDRAPFYVSFPQLVPLPNGNFLLGYGLMAANHDEGKPYAELKGDLEHPRSFWLGEIDRNGNVVNEPRELPAGVGWSEFDQLLATEDGRAVWSQPGTSGSTLYYHVFDYTAHFANDVDSVLGPSHETVMCPSGQAVNRTILASESNAATTSGVPRGVQISCAFLDWSGQPLQGVSQGYLFTPNPADGTIRHVATQTCDGLGNAMTGFRAEPGLSVLADCHFERGRQISLGDVGACRADEVLKGFELWYAPDEQGGTPADVTHMRNICASFDALEVEKEGIISVSGYFEDEILACEPGEVVAGATLIAGDTEVITSRDGFSGVRLTCHDAFDNPVGQSYSVAAGSFPDATFDSAIASGTALDYLRYGHELLNDSDASDILSLCPQANQRITGLRLRHDIGANSYAGALAICDQSTETLACNNQGSIARAETTGIVGSPAQHLAEVSVHCPASASAGIDAAAIARSNFDAGTPRDREVESNPHAPFFADGSALSNAALTLASCEPGQVVDSLRLVYDQRFEAYIHVQPLCAVAQLASTTVSAQRGSGDGWVRHCNGSLDVEIEYRTRPGLLGWLSDGLFGSDRPPILNIDGESRDFITVGRKNGGIRGLRAFRARKDARSHQNQCVESVINDSSVPADVASCNNANVWTQNAADDGSVPEDGLVRDFESVFGQHWSLRHSVRNTIRTQTQICSDHALERANFSVNVDYDSRNPTGLGCWHGINFLDRQFTFDEICGAPGVYDEDPDLDDIVNADEFPGCERDPSADCGLLREQATVILNEIGGTQYEGDEVAIDAPYQSLQTSTSTCFDLVDQVATDYSKDSLDFYRICGWEGALDDERYVRGLGRSLGETLGEMCSDEDASDCFIGDKYLPVSLRSINNMPHVDWTVFWSGPKFYPEFDCRDPASSALAKCTEPDGSVDQSLLVDTINAGGSNTFDADRHYAIASCDNIDCDANDYYVRGPFHRSLFGHAAYLYQGTEFCAEYAVTGNHWNIFKSAWCGVGSTPIAPFSRAQLTDHWPLALLNASDAVSSKELYMIFTCMRDVDLNAVWTAAAGPDSSTTAAPPAGNYECDIGRDTMSAIARQFTSHDQQVNNASAELAFLIAQAVEIEALSAGTGWLVKSAAEYAQWSESTINAARLIGKNSVHAGVDGYFAVSSLKEMAECDPDNFSCIAQASVQFVMASLAIGRNALETEEFFSGASSILAESADPRLAAMAQPLLQGAREGFESAGDRLPEGSRPPSQPQSHLPEEEPFRDGDPDSDVDTWGATCPTTPIP